MSNRCDENEYCPSTGWCNDCQAFVRDDWENRCSSSIRATVPENKRIALADKFGPNWASIISGLGDQ